MKISYNWLKNIFLIFILLFIPFNHIKASFCDPFPDSMVISAILMVTIAAIIFMHIFTEKEEFLIKVLTFCGFFGLFFILLIPIIGSFVFVIVIAAFIMNIIARKKKLLVRMLIFIISFILVFFISIYLFPLGFHPADLIILLVISVVTIYLSCSKKRKIFLNIIMFIFIVLSYIFCYNNDRIKDFYTTVKCEILNGEIVEDYCNLRCELR